MIKILHISDLHFYEDAQARYMQDILLREAEKEVSGLNLEEKILIITGDFHNYSDGNYNAAERFLNNLISVMKIDRTKDVFVVPGNHDVGNDQELNVLGINSKLTKSAVYMLKQGDLSYLEDRMKSYYPYCNFVRKLEIYPESEDILYPARIHMRQWRGLLNILHLNTTLIADGTSHDNQMVDINAVANTEIWRQDDLPALALGHNNFFDLETRQQLALQAMFEMNNVSAYLSGDTHRTELNTRNQLIPLEVGANSNRRSIPNLVCAKSIGAMSDTYSDFGFYWHEWDEIAGKVKVLFHRWKPEYLSKTIHDPTADGCYMMRYGSSEIESSEEIPDVFVTYKVDKYFHDFSSTLFSYVKSLTDVYDQIFSWYRGEGKALFKNVINGEVGLPKEILYQALNDPNTAAQQYDIVFRKLVEELNAQSLEMLMKTIESLKKSLPIAIDFNQEYHLLTQVLVTSLVCDGILAEERLIEAGLRLSIKERIEKCKKNNHTFSLMYVLEILLNPPNSLLGYMLNKCASIALRVKWQNKTRIYSDKESHKEFVPITLEDIELLQQAKLLAYSGHFSKAGIAGELEICKAIIRCDDKSSLSIRKLKDDIGREMDYLKWDKLADECYEKMKTSTMSDIPANKS